MIFTSSIWIATWRLPTSRESMPILTIFRLSRQHGGKLLLYHGWADQAIPPGNTVNFYSAVLDKMGPDQSDWLRLFMIPGMQHCAGGQGTDQFNKMAVIERWREEGKAPAQIVAAHVTNAQIDMTRPLCPYPQVAVYKGSGLTTDAGNFTCKGESARGDSSRSVHLRNMPKIVRFHSIGGPENLKLDDLPSAPPGEGEVKLRVQAAGLNRAEALFMRGVYVESQNCPRALVTKPRVSWKRLEPA